MPIHNHTQTICARSADVYRWVEWVDRPSTNGRCQCRTSRPCLNSIMNPCNFLPPASCPPCPDMPIPDMTCNPGYIAVLRSEGQLTGTLLLENAFGPEGYPTPYTIQSLEFIGTQQSVYNVTITPLSSCMSRVMGTIRSELRLVFTDGIGNAHTREIPVAIPFDLEACIFGPTDVATLVSYLQNAVISNIQLQNGNISFTYTLDQQLIGYQTPARSFASIELTDQRICLPDFIPTSCRTLLPIFQLCNANITLGTDTSGTIPFTPQGTAPYTVLNVTPLPGVNILSTATDATLGTTTLELAFPVSLTLQSSEGITFTQESQMVTIVTFWGALPEDTQQLLLNLTLDLPILPVVLENTLFVNAGTITGTLALTGLYPAPFIVADFISCGDPAPCACSIGGV